MLLFEFVRVDFAAARDPDGPRRVLDSANPIVNKYYEDVKMDPAVLAETVANYNSYVDAGEDPEWGTVDHLVNKIETGPFYAAWAASPRSRSPSRAAGSRPST